MKHLVPLYETTPKPITKLTMRLVEILKALGSSQNSVSNISRQLNLSKATTCRLLKGLEQSGLVIQDPVNRKYYLGHLLISLASNPVVAHQHLIHCAHDKMEYLCQISGESVGLYIKLGNQRVRLERVTSNRDVRYVGRPSIIGPLYAGAQSKVLLAQLSEKEFSIILDSLELLSITSHTITNKNILKEEIEKSRKLGYSISNSETTEAVTSIAVPILSYIEPVALSIVGPEYRFGSRMLDFLPELKKCATEISEEFVKIRARQIIV